MNRINQYKNGTWSSPFTRAITKNLRAKTQSCGKMGTKVENYELFCYIEPQLSIFNFLTHFISTLCFSCLYKGNGCTIQMGTSSGRREMRCSRVSWLRCERGIPLLFSHGLVWEYPGTLWLYGVYEFPCCNYFWICAGSGCVLVFSSSNWVIPLPPLLSHSLLPRWS